MKPRILPALLAIALVACAARGTTPLPAASGGGSDSEPSSSELGTFDQPALEKTFDTVFTHEDLTFSKSRYTAGYRLPLSLEFTIHPADQAKRILETSLRLSVDRPDSEVALERTWFKLMLSHQPAALEWLRQQRDDYLARPGPDTSIRSMFGPVCTGFFTFGAETSASGRSTTMGYFVETQDAHVNCNGLPDGT
jgi:hypothetical protein